MQKVRLRLGSPAETKIEVGGVDLTRFCRSFTVRSNAGDLVTDLELTIPTDNLDAEGLAEVVAALTKAGVDSTEQ